MNSTEYFNQLKRAEIRSENLKNKLEVLRENIQSVKGTNFKSDVIQTSRTLSTLEEVVTDIINLEQRFTEEVIKRATLYNKALVDISYLDNEISASILIKRYLLNWKWDKIAESIGYSMSRTFELHAQALKDFNKLL